MYFFLALVAIFILLLLYIFLVEPKQLVVREERVAVNPNAIHGSLRILFISDLHFGWATSWNQVKAKLDIVHSAHQEKHFDLLLLGGDYLDISNKYLPLLRKSLADLKTLRLPMYAVLGNHDYNHGTIDEKEVLDALKEAGIKVLQNEAELIKIGKEELALIGIDDLEKSPAYKGKNLKNPREYRERAELLDWYHPHDRFHPQTMRVVLAHNPDTVYMQGAVRPDVVLAGHTHGGQFAFLDWFGNFFFKLHLVPESSFVTWAGRQLINGTTLLVGRGFASSTLPGRFLRKPEVLSIILEKADIPAHLIIGLSGKPRSGKDTAARIIQSQLPGIKMIGFSDAIRDEYDAEYGTNTRLSEKEKDRHRATMQEFGAGKVKQDINYWIKRVLAHQPPILITGVRRITEAEAIQVAGGKLIRIEVSEESLRQRMDAEHFEANKNHDNETQLDTYPTWDFVIENNGSEAEFEAKVLALVEKLH
jgi:phosphomevalonate kinase